MLWLLARQEFEIKLHLSVHIVYAVFVSIRTVYSIKIIKYISIISCQNNQKVTKIVGQQLLTLNPVYNHLM